LFVLLKNVNGRSCRQAYTFSTQALTENMVKLKTHPFVFRRKNKISIEIDLEEGVVNYF
jgi:hypothetical protein